MASSVELAQKVEEALMLHLGLLCQHPAQGQHGHIHDNRRSRRGVSPSEPSRVQGEYPNRRMQSSAGTCWTSGNLHGCTAQPQPYSLNIALSHADTMYRSAFHAGASAVQGRSSRLPSQRVLMWPLAGRVPHALQASIGSSGRSAWSDMLRSAVSTAHDLTLGLCAGH